MYNYQNELQMLGMDQYQVGELMPIEYQSQTPIDFSDVRRCGCGGCGRCGGFGFRCGGCFGCGGCGGCGGCFGGFGLGLGLGGCFGFFI